MEKERDKEGNLAVPVIQFKASKNLESLKLKLPSQAYMIEWMDSKSVGIRKVEFEIK